MKLFELYNFNDTKYSIPGKPEDIVHGIWVVESVKNLHDDILREWGLRRVATFDNNYPVGERVEFPDIVFKVFGCRVDRAHLSGEHCQP